MVLIYTIIGIVLILCVLIFISNNMHKITEYRVVNSKIPKAFNNLNIVQISDTHSKMFGKNNEKLIKIVKSKNPDIIVMSGDIITKKINHIEKAIEMFKN